MECPHRLHQRAAPHIPRAGGDNKTTQQHNNATTQQQSNKPQQPNNRATEQPSNRATERPSDRATHQTNGTTINRQTNKPTNHETNKTNKPTKTARARTVGERVEHRLLAVEHERVPFELLALLQ